MNSIENAHAHMSLAPLGAGDLIDRAVRFYRKNFWTFVLISSPPVIVGTIFLVAWTTLGRSIFSLGSTSGMEVGIYRVFAALGNLIIWLIQMIATLVIMGGASRNFVRHLLYGEPITFRETYRNSVNRLWGLVGISTLISIICGIFGFFVFYLGFIVITLGIIAIALLFQSFPIMAFIVGIVAAIAIIFGTLWVMFLMISRFVYVPQIMLVEGQGAFAAVSRSFSLAGKNVERVAMLFVFTFFATYLALAILYVPLGWYAWFEGVEIFSFSGNPLPAWYEISSQLISQVSLILLTPIWMIGFCLLYIDERVRKEGYDIELLAAKRLGDIPVVPQEYINPLQPALSKNAAPGNQKIAASPTTKKADGSIFGLK